MAAVPPPQAGYQSGSSGVQSYSGEMPTEDVHEKSSAEGPPSASAPPVSAMDRVSGYENANFDSAGTYVAPPTYDQAMVPEPDQSTDIQPNIPNISEDAARAALLNEVSGHCCYGKKAANDLVFTNIVPTSAFHYQLETFAEGRKTAWAYEPFTGQLIDGPQNGPAPGPWDIAAHPGKLFEDEVKHFEVPHTASVKMCHNCGGAGMNRCWKCLGRGRVICGSCDGSGHIMRPVVHHEHHHHHDHHHGHHHHGHHHHGGSHVDMERVCCHHCNGTGRKRCNTCGGCGQIQCGTCRGRCNLKCYIKLTVSWKNHKADHVVERTALPDHLIRGAEGKIAFQDQHPRVAPVVTFPDAAVNDASRSLVQSHSTAFPTERILQQRHWIRIVPVSEARCTFKGKDFTFFVYGYDNIVHNPDYPQQMCWGCTLL